MILRPRWLPALLALLCCPPAALSQESGASEKVFVGYVFRPPTHINFKLYTHLCHAFITADGNGVLRTNRNVPSANLVKEAHAAGVKVLLSLGGWGWDEQFAAIVRDPEAEKRYVASVMSIVDDFDYDGVDLDWEYPDTSEEVPGFERLARTFRSELDSLGSRKGRRMLQTMAVSSSPSTLKWLSNEILLGAMDWINVMTYDMAGEWTSYAGHHSPLHASSRQPGTPQSSELTIQHLLDRGLPPDRLALGIPLYGKGFPVSEPYVSTRRLPPGNRPPGGAYSRLMRLQKEEGWIRKWDDETKAPWLIAPDGSGVIGYDDPESAALKGRWAREMGLRGVFFWEVAGDRLEDGSNPVQEAARQALYQNTQ
jgi:chitinase